MGKLKTVLIQHPGDPASPLRINESDLKSHHVLWDVAKPPATANADPVAESEPEALEPEAASEVSKWDLLFNSGGWQAVKTAAEAIGYEKPEYLSWKESLPEIEEWEALLASEAAK